MCHVIKKDYTKVLKKTSQSKRIQFSKDRFLQGGGLFRDLMKGVAKTIKKVMLQIRKF